MAVRSDVTVDYFITPRIVRVAAPSFELTIQDLHDTVRDIEDEPNRMQHRDLISSAGKEALGGGVLVGLTSTLRDAVVAFDARKTSVSAGTVTTPDSTGRILIDSGATFIADGVNVGAGVFNSTDGSVASVVSVDSETQLTTDVLGDGADNQFESGDVYKIWNVTQCEVSGGNLVAVDGAGSPISAILPTIGTQIVRTSSASATLQELLDIQHSSFGGGVSLDALSGFSGTSFPTGTPRQPVNNLADAKLIAAERGFSTLFISGNFNFVALDALTAFTLIGESQARSTVDVDPAAALVGCEFQDMTLTGIIGANSVTRNVLHDGISFVSGQMFDGFLKGTTTLTGSGQVDMLDMNSLVPGINPILDMSGGAGSLLAIKDYHGDLQIQNKTGPETISIDMGSGQLILDATITNGTIICRGVGKLTDNSTGTTVVVDELLSGLRQILMEKIARNELIVDPVTGTITVLDDDGIATFLSANLFEDTAEAQAYRGKGVSVRKRMT